MKTKLIIILFISFGIVAAQDNHEKSYTSFDVSISALIDGTLLRPDTTKKIPLVIIIGGSGPTDRNGNQQMMENNSLRYLAQGLYDQGIASFRYDKRILKQMKERTLIEKDIRFDDFISDAISVTNYFRMGDEFSEIHILGHSQGSLVGMMAAQGRVDGFISIAGAGQQIDGVIVDQLRKQAPGLVENAQLAFDDIRVNGIALNYSPGLASIFRADIQPFIKSWMEYDPKIEIARLEIPVLVINGDKDLQVQVSEAELLQKAKPDAQFNIIPNMNHVLKFIEGDDIENSKSYNRYDLPVMPELIEIINNFITN